MATIVELSNRGFIIGEDLKVASSLVWKIGKTFGVANNYTYLCRKLNDNKQKRWKEKLN